MDDPYPQEFPFGIQDVAELLQLRVRRRQPDSMESPYLLAGSCMMAVLPVLYWYLHAPTWILALSSLQLYLT